MTALTVGLIAGLISLVCGCFVLHRAYQHHKNGRPLADSKTEFYTQAGLTLVVTLADFVFLAAIIYCIKDIT